MKKTFSALLLSALFFLGSNAATNAKAITTSGYWHPPLALAPANTITITNQSGVGAIVEVYQNALNIAYSYYVDAGTTQLFTGFLLSPGTEYYCSIYLEDSGVVSYLLGNSQLWTTMDTDGYFIITGAPATLKLTINEVFY